MGSPMLIDPHPCQRHAGVHYKFLPLQDLTRSMARYIPTSPDKSEVDLGINQAPNCLSWLLPVCSPWLSSLSRTTLVDQPSK